jgi:hypothetical protein
MDALRIWQGGLGIWGAIALGALGAWFGCRRAGVRILDFADAAAPGVALAQAIGRWGNWFNNELYGSATDLPWGLVIHEWDTERRPGGPRRQRQCRSCSAPSTRPSSMSSIFVRIARGRAASGSTGAGLRPRPALRAASHGLPDRQAHHREDAHRPGERHSRPAAQRLDLDPGLPPRSHALSSRGPDDRQH